MTYFCMFCAIVREQAPAEIHYQDDDLLVIADRNPRAPVHQLVIPRQHIPSLNDTTDPALLGHMLLAAARMAARQGIDQTGYRTFINTGHHAWQTVPHLHLHLMGGAPLTFDRATEIAK